MPESPSLPAPPLSSAEQRTPWWLWIQVLCLDAPVVVVLWQMALARTHHIHLPAPFYWGLGLVTWAVYVLDRTADALSGRLSAPLSARHAFYLRHYKPVLFAVLPLAVAAMAWIALHHLPAGLLWRGVAMAMLGTTYLACFSAGPSSILHRFLVGLSILIGIVLITRLPFPPAYKMAMSLGLWGTMTFAALGRLDPRWRALLPKEFVAAVLLTLGCSTGVHFWSADSHPDLCLEFGLISGLCLINLLGISSSEHLAKLHTDPASVLRMRPSLSALLPWLIVLLFGMSAWIAAETFRAHQTPGVAATALVVACASALSGLLHRFVAQVRPELYHLLADAALVVPLPILFWLMPK